MADPLTHVETDPAQTRPADFGPPMPVPLTRRSGRGGTIALVAAAFIAIGGIAFAGGRLTAPVAAATGQSGSGTFRFGPGRSFQPGDNFPGGAGGRIFGASGVTLRGQVSAISGTSITLQLQDGTSLTLPLDSSTTYHQATTASASAVKVGDTVAVQPGAPSLTAGSSPAPVGSPSTRGQGAIQFGPAVDVTVITN